MMTDNYNINFTGLTHDHTNLLQQQQLDTPTDDHNGRPPTLVEPQAAEVCSVIAILRRHPMYDCLVLVKKFRNCLAGYSLEFPVDKLTEDELQAVDGSGGGANEENAVGASTTTTTPNCCSQKRLVSRYLDGDDPMHHACNATLASLNSATTITAGHHQDSLQVDNPPPLTAGQELTSTTTTSPGCLVNPFVLQQIDDRGDQCELVHVPINGLLDRLDSYTRNQVAVDSRVYAFAMGLKTAERIMTTKSMKELQETPI